MYTYFECVYIHILCLIHPCIFPTVGDVESLYLLATCQYRSGRLQQARHLLSKLSPSRHAPSDLLLATICLDLDE